MWRARLSLVALAVAIAATPSRAQDRLNVVASFSILGDFVRNVGGDRVNVTSWSVPMATCTSIRRAPADAKKIADANLIVINGLGLEGWLPRLLQSSGSKAPIVTATKGIAPLKLGSDADPHAWQSVANAKIYVANIRDALGAADPPDAEAISRQCASLSGRSSMRWIARCGQPVAKIPPDAPQGDLDPRRLRLFRGRLRHRIHRAAGRFHRIRAQRARYRWHHQPRSGRRKSRRFFLKISAMTG